MSEPEEEARSDSTEKKKKEKRSWKKKKEKREQDEQQQVEEQEQHRWVVLRSFLHLQVLHGTTEISEWSIQQWIIEESYVCLVKDT